MQPINNSWHDSKPRSSAWLPELVEGLTAFGPLGVVMPLLARHPSGGPWPTVADYCAWAEACGLVNARGLPVRFVEAAPKKARRRSAPVNHDPRAYERSVYERGEVPTRAESWHDLFNALCWLMFPKTKAALNERQYLSPSMPTERDLVRAQTRTREQDRLSMFDEGGLIACGDDFFVVGHAVYEQLAIGTAPIRAMVLPVILPAKSTALVRESDAAAADLVKACIFRGETSFTTRSLR